MDGVELGENLLTVWDALHDVASGGQWVYGSVVLLLGINSVLVIPAHHALFLFPCWLSCYSHR